MVQGPIGPRRFLALYFRADLTDCVNDDMQKIYIVDDDDSVRKAIARLFRLEGFNCEAFASGEAFLAGLPDDAQGCVVMDIRMPGLTGYDVQQKLRTRGQSIPVIALSAQDDDEARERARRMGATTFYRKPVDNQALLDSVRWLLGAQKLPTQAQRT